MARLPGRGRAQQISAGARARTGDALDRVLDWIFAEPFEVPPDVIIDNALSDQFTVIEGQHNRRPDIVVFVNGLPLGLIELKNAADEDAKIVKKNFLPYGR